VRVVDIGGWSVELCGGTHVRSTAEIGPFAILSESSVGAGARRIEAVTAGEAFAYLREQAREADGLRSELERVRKESKKPQAEASAEFEIVGREGDVLFVEAKALKGGPLRDLSDRLRQQEKAAGAVVASSDDGRAFLVVNFDESLVAKGLDASQLVRALGAHIGGGGGGKPTLAEAGGKNPAGVRDALEAGRKAVARGARIKVMALDYGSARTGVAVSDPTGIIARPLCVVERVRTDAGLAELVRLVREEQPEHVIVGLPLTLRGEHGEQARETEIFAREAPRHPRRAGAALRRALPRPTSPSRRPRHHRRTRAPRRTSCPDTSRGRAAPRRDAAQAGATAQADLTRSHRAAPAGRARRRAAHDRRRLRAREDLEPRLVLAGGADRPDHRAAQAVPHRLSRGLQQR